MKSSIEIQKWIFFVDKPSLNIPIVTLFRYVFQRRTTAKFSLSRRDAAMPWNDLLTLRLPIHWKYVYTGVVAGLKAPGRPAIDR